MADIFLSYSRQDTPFVLRLQRALRRQGREPWIDVDGIRPAENFMEAIRVAIDSTYAFVFVISPDSIMSTVCMRELEHALNGSKRLIPVVHRQVPATDVPAALRDLNWIPFVESAGSKKSVFTGLVDVVRFEKSVRQLITAADADLAWIRVHTRLLQRAREWTEKGRSDSLLLQGDDLESTLALVGNEKSKQPKLGDLQLHYLDASSRTAKALPPILHELDAVKRMQMHSLPRPETVFDGDKRFEVFAAQEQARQVGGDLYDFYRVDDDRILLLVGDVSGKGLPASYMAAVTKAMFKTAALRGRSNIAEVVCEVDREIARDNANALFVTAFAAILNVQTGYLEYCSAGGEPALLISDQPGRAVAELDSDRALGPPLAAVDGFPYEAAGLEMKHGDMLLVFTDGLSEALDQAGTLYGRDTLRTSLSNLPRIERAEMLGEAVLHDWRAFTAGTMPTDDVTVLALRWN